MGDTEPQGAAADVPERPLADPRGGPAADPWARHAAARPAGLVAPSRGIWTFTADVDLLRRLAGSGFDWLAVDAQHGPVDRGTLHAIGRGLAGAAAPFAVRVPGVEPSWIGAALDAGAAAVVVPSVTGIDDAVAAARACRYPPRGERSWGPFAPLWGGTAPDPAAANAAASCLVMVETVGALEAVEDIAAAPGVDGLFVGPLDLALALGTTVDALLGDREPGSPLQRVAEACRRHGILVGAFAGDARKAGLLRAHGIRCLAVTTDVAVVTEGVRAVLDSDRG